MSEKKARETLRRLAAVLAEEDDEDDLLSDVPMPTEEEIAAVVATVDVDALYARLMKTATEAMAARQAADARRSGVHHVPAPRAPHGEPEPAEQ